MKILSIIFGLLMVIGGVYCMASPVATFSTLALIIGISMVVDGVGGIVAYFELRKIGHVSGWILVAAIASVVLGAFVLGSTALQVAIDNILAYLVAFWLIVAGFRRIGASFDMHTLNKLGSALGRYWFLVLVSGILVVIFGVLCVIYPVYAMMSVGLLMGFSIIVSGLSFIAFALSY